MLRRSLFFLLILFVFLSAFDKQDQIEKEYRDADFTTVEKAIQMFKNETGIDLEKPSYIPIETTHTFGRYLDEGYYKGKLQLEYINSKTNDVIDIWVSSLENGYKPKMHADKILIDKKHQAYYETEVAENHSSSALTFCVDDKSYRIEMIRPPSKEVYSMELLREIANKLIEHK
ncbi:hypothetical protein [Shouchella miscanthi]|uniref:DUF4367 domain-containing protein n=1 Tax=Shouchella miscanthi TaxID=2598861 RepID=A0ABU6NRX4_9BACI|nr:hypothetical protein [Shouchella miscanthi]